jgi:CRP/FNR family transcriptional regulator, dissimilatory nitrate respiration regulator
MTEPNLDPIHVIAHSPLFAGLHATDLAAIAQIAQLEHYNTNQTVFWEGDQPSGLHLVMTGAVKVFKLAGNTGRELILTVEHAGQALAELPSLDGGKYPANAAAVQPTTLLLLPRDDLEALMLERPHLTRHLLKAVGSRLRHLVGLIEALSFQQVIGRLSTYLLEREASHGIPFQLETNATIAAHIGTVNELVTRNLSRLSNNKLIRLEGRTVEWLDRNALEQKHEN